MLYRERRKALVVGDVSKCVDERIHGKDAADNADVIAKEGTCRHNALKK